MKQTRLLRTLLAAVCLFVGTNAWGTDTNATLEHTASTCCGTDKTAITYSLDGEKAHYNQEGSNAWQGYAFAKFSFSLPTGENVTSAKLTWTASTTSTARNHSVYYLNPGKDVDYNAISGQTAGLLRYNGSKTFIVTENFGNEKTIETDVTAAISAMVSAKQNYIVFQWTNNAGGGDLYGKGSATKAPALVITTTTETTYSITFTETNGVTATVKIGDTDVTSGTNLTNGNYSFTATATGYEAYNGNFTVNGADKNVDFTMTEATPVTSLTVKAKIGSETYTIKSIDLTDKYVGDVVTITYPRLWLVGTTLYSTTQNAHGNGYYKWNYTLDGNDAVVEYNTTEATGVVYYSEGENIEGMTADASGNADIRCSDGKGGRSSEELSLTSLGSGIYKLTSRVWGNAGITFTYRIQGADILTQSTVGYLDDKNIKFNVLSGTATIKVQGSNNDGKVIDYVYIQKLDDSSASIYNGDFENNTWGEGWSGTGTDKAKEFAVQTSSQTWGATGKFAEMWTGTNSSYTTEAHLRQILVNVPAGDYTISADILNNVQSSGGVLYAKVGNDSEITTAAESATGANERVSFTVAEPSVVVVGFKTTSINGENGWIAVDNFELKQFVPVTITPTGYATFSSPYALDFSNQIDNLDGAYYASAVETGKVTMTKLEQAVPAETGLFLKGKANETVTIPVVASGTTINGTNYLKPNTTSKEIAASTENAYHYVFAYTTSDSSNPGFFNLGNNVTLGAGKAYIETTTSIKPTAGAKVSILFTDTELTGIVNAEANETTNAKTGKIYNIAGQVVTESYKGIKIIDGKKVF